MQPDTRKNLIDILDAATDIQTFIHQYDAIIWDVVSSKLASFVSSVETLARS